MMKHLIPADLRIRLRIAARDLQDLVRGERARLVQAPLEGETQANFPPQISITQPIKVTPFVENKCHNLALALRSINDVAIHPGQIFSFWALVGAPTRQRGYLPGQTILQQTLQASDGGGLCHLSGLLYLLALTAGLTPVERHTHSVDIYTEATRYTPLGSDATVVYGYKDFRCLNSLNQPICFRLELEPDSITGHLCAEQAIDPYHLAFIPEEQTDWIEVETLQWSDQQSSIKRSLGKSRYARPQSIAPLM